MYRVLGGIVLQNLRYRNRYRKDLAKHRLFVNKTALEWVQRVRILCLYA